MPVPGGTHPKGGNPPSHSLFECDEAPIMATPQEEKAMRDRVFTLLMSPAAQRIDFFLDRLHVDGDAFRWVAGSLVIKQLGFKGIGVRFGQVAAGGDASMGPVSP